MYPIIDITLWEHADIYVSGSKEKRWYINSQTNQLHLFKLPVSLTDDNWKVVGENTGEESLIEGADMIMEFDRSYDRSKLKGEHEVYSYDLLWRLFSNYNELDYLYKMIVFDTLIGNTDRHQDNFGLIRNEWTNELRMSPLYDNSSSLGRELPSSKIELMFKDPRMLEAYLFNKKAASLIKWGNIESFEKLNAFELLKRIREVNPQITSYMKNLELLTDDRIENIINQVPEVVMDELRKRFVSTVLQKRRNAILKEL